MTERTDRAVSPVIGVILMVAITVILAAVIGVFVLGLGDELGEAAPSNSLSVDGEIEVASNAALDVTISHDSGDSVNTDDLTVILREDGSNFETFDSSDFDDTAGVGADEEYSVGDQIVIDESDVGDTQSGEEFTIRVVHDPSESIIGSGELDIDDS